LSVAALDIGWLQVQLPREEMISGKRSFVWVLSILYHIVNCSAAQTGTPFRRQQVCPIFGAAAAAASFNGNSSYFNNRSSCCNSGNIRPLFRELRRRPRVIIAISTSSIARDDGGGSGCNQRSRHYRTKEEAN